MNGRPTSEYAALDQAYDFLNAEFFGGKLPLCMITLTNRPNSYGYYAHKRFKSRLGEDESVSEIGLVPGTFYKCTDAYIVSTLLHEMVHLWEYHLPDPPRKAYHGKRWANKMDEVGLCPSNTGQPGGRRTGQKCSHYVPESGPFIEAWSKLALTGFVIGWQALTIDKPKESKQSKVKYTCPTCALNAWAKPDVQLICGTCNLTMESEL